MPLNELPTIPADAPKYGQDWKHFKGKLAFIYGVFIHSETSELMVAYREHDGNCRDPRKDPQFVRPLALFMDTHVTGVKRFTKIV